MGHLGAELDLGPIDKVDVRNEIRRLTVLLASQEDFQKHNSYCKPKVCPITINPGIRKTGKKHSKSGKIE